MTELIQPSADCFYPQKDDPIVGQASGDKKLASLSGFEMWDLWIWKPWLLWSRKKVSIRKCFGIGRTSFLGRLDVGNKMDRFLGFFATK